MGLRGRKFCHSQGGTSDVSELWKFKELSSLQYITLRYQLIPYVKKLFQMLQATGRTIMRPLYYDFSSSDDNVVNGTRANDPSIIHEYMFGENNQSRVTCFRVMSLFSA